ncbi:MAG: hypothetical protein J6Z18_02490 [Prevotella sp.]|nr:hypothetical protein [Prevotella sp.]
MKRNFITIITIVFLCCPLLTNAQKKVEADVQVDLVSRHMWRGQDYGKISLQPQGTIKYQGFYLSGFGSTGFADDDINRIDISLGYQAPFGLNIGVSDNWKSGVDPYNRYFSYEEKTTGHTFEGNLGFRCKYFSLQGYCIFMGNDFKLNGDRAYSTYIELSVPFRFAKVEWLATVGGNPMESAGWRGNGKDGSYLDEYLYSDGIGICLASLRATKVLHVKNPKVDIPVFVEFNANPYTQKAALLGGISIKPFK